ncbi:MAG TPA: 6-phosphogluconolactonase, partial [Nakamurella sp.]
MTPEVVIHSSPDLLAATTAARLVTKLVDIQSSGRIPAIALTGGGVGIKVLSDLNASPARDAVDWSWVEILWGD